MSEKSSARSGGVLLIFRVVAIVFGEYQSVTFPACKDICSECWLPSRSLRL